MRLEVEACVLCYHLPNWKSGQACEALFFKSNRVPTPTCLWPCQARLACLFSVSSLQCQESSDFCEESPRPLIADSVHRIKLLPHGAKRLQEQPADPDGKTKQGGLNRLIQYCVAGTCRTKIGLLPALVLANRELRTFIILRSPTWR